MQQQIPRMQEPNGTYSNQGVPTKHLPVQEAASNRHSLESKYVTHKRYLIVKYRKPW